MTASELALPGLLAGLLAMLVAWLISVVRRDVSIVDSFWGLSILAIALVYGWLQTPLTARTVVVLAVVVAWALRLAIYVARRNHGQPEDRRYRAMREKRGESFWWRSLYVVFLLQAVLAWIVSLPALGAIAGTAPFGWLDAVGAALAGFGLIFETVADQQLAAFLRRPESAGQVMDRGLWRYSRHPNYFGEFCVWWGLGLMALATGAWWAMIGPALLSIFLLKVSGVALTEKDIAERRPAYQQYMRRTSAFFPRPPANQE